MEKRTTEQQKAPDSANKPQANQPNDEADAAHRSGQFGADKPGADKDAQTAKRPADKQPNTKGPEYEEGGQYPGKRPEGK